DCPCEIIDGARDVAEDSARDVGLHGLTIRMARGPNGYPDASRLPARRPRAFLHDADRLANELLGDAVHEDNAVGNPSGQLKHLGARGRDVDRHRRADMTKLRAPSFADGDGV